VCCGAVVPYKQDRHKGVQAGQAQKNLKQDRHKSVQAGQAQKNLAQTSKRLNLSKQPAFGQ
jgi:hypothetical protein